MSTDNNERNYCNEPLCEMTPKGWRISIMGADDTRKHSLIKILRKAWIEDGWTVKQMQRCAQDLVQVLGEMNREWKKFNPDYDLIERKTMPKDQRSDAELLEAYVKLEGYERRQFFAVHGARIWRAYEALCRARKVGQFGNN